MDPFAELGSSGGAAPKKRAKVKFDYKPLAGNQIPLIKGTTIEIITLGKKGEWTKGIDPASGRC